MIGNPEQQSDIFYTWTHDEELVWDEFKGNGYKVYRCGEMKVFYTDPNGEQHTLRYTDDFIEVGLDTDDKVAKADEAGQLAWDNNPWFSICHDEYCGVIAMSDEIFGRLDEAIERAIHLGSCEHLTMREDGSCEDCYYTEEAN